MRIGSIIIFHLSTLWKAKFPILCDVIFLLRLQGKFEWSLLGLKGLTPPMSSFSSSSFPLPPPTTPPEFSVVTTVIIVRYHSDERFCILACWGLFPQSTLFLMVAFAFILDSNRSRIASWRFRAAMCSAVSRCWKKGVDMNTRVFTSQIRPWFFKTRLG